MCGGMGRRSREILSGLHSKAGMSSVIGALKLEHLIRYFFVMKEYNTHPGRSPGSPTAS